MENFEEKYKNALEVAQRFYNNSAAITKKGLEDIFPELAEGDDERIMKAILGLTYIDGIEPILTKCSVTRQDIRAYLEEQGEQKPAWSEEDDKILQGIWDEILANKHEAKECEWKTYDKFLDWLDSLKERCLPPKPEWSEEDEDDFKHLMDEIVCLGNSRNSANRLHYDRLIKFLDELKNRIQPREEWCDKDERMLDRLIAYFEKRVAFTDEDNPRYANWLKSLRDRYTWKPSEGQLECLGYAIENAEKDWSPLTNNRTYLTLKALREQLLELRGSKV